MITVAIPLADASPANHIELKYSLRSLEAVYGEFKLAIIGTKLPQWLTRIDIIIPCIDLPGPAEKENNIRRKFYRACDVISGNFLWSNDDFFITDHWNDSDLKCRGLLSETLRETQSPGYRRSIENTMGLIGTDWFDFDNHAPMWVEPDKLKKVPFFTLFGYLHKTLYQHYAIIPATTPFIYPDIKLRTRPDANILQQLENAEYFSTSHAAMTPAFVKWLDNKWPHKSRFEI